MCEKACRKSNLIFFQQMALTALCVDLKLVQHCLNAVSPQKRFRFSLFFRPGDENKLMKPLALTTLLSILIFIGKYVLLSRIHSLCVLKQSSDGGFFYIPFKCIHIMQIIDKNGFCTEQKSWLLLLCSIVVVFQPGPAEAPVNCKNIQSNANNSLLSGVSWIPYLKS